MKKVDNMDNVSRDETSKEDKKELELKTTVMEMKSSLVEWSQLRKE